MRDHLVCRRAFSDEWLAFGQAWLPALEPGFQPGRVRVASDGAQLLVEAELMDRDVFNPVTEFNTPFFLAGDTFEIFLQAAGVRGYCEIHIGPANQKLQLRFPGWEERAQFLNHRFATPVIVSATQLLVDGWAVRAAVPFSLLGPAEEWRVAFGRYDYRRGSATPVISSTAPHPVLDFHRPREWHRLRLG